MGDFYGKRLKDFLAPVFVLPGWWLLGQDSDSERKRRIFNREAREKLVKRRESIQILLIELLRYQPWANTQPN
jgi:hypothetical protein